ncbi:hypothetical protein SDC9_199040 [bioreactor metagenome]|uniref:Uncharacterized protein n=1 Tax=bioreactor metagenome TaxID=1076179 RepID=A0A645IJD0_9ZZZZ
MLHAAREGFWIAVLETGQVDHLDVTVSQLVFFLYAVAGGRALHTNRLVLLGEGALVEELEAVLEVLTDCHPRE